jgi:hypothetical protein
MIEYLGAYRYSINIEKMDDDIYSLEFVFYYDKNNEEQRNTFQKSVPLFNTQAKLMSSIPNVRCNIEIDKKNLILKLKMTSEFRRIADTIIGEFISHGALGKATLAQLFQLVTIGLTDVKK